MTKLRTFSKNKVSTYVSKPTDAIGYVDYSHEENQIWETLYQRQIQLVQARACEEFLQGLDILKMPSDKIPQIPEINKAMNKATGWGVKPVSALIKTEVFFKLLTAQLFPAATFIRRQEELDYLQEPDIFHEIFGHCPLLTEPNFAKFMQNYGTIAGQANSKQLAILSRLYWFTVEFGLIQTAKGPLSYGGGILSSIGETVYAVESPEPQRQPFDLLTAMRTPYRIDQFQTIYFVIESFEQLFEITHDNLLDRCDEAIRLGDFEPSFPIDDLID